MEFAGTHMLPLLSAALTSVGSRKKAKRRGQHALLRSLALISQGNDAPLLDLAIFVLKSKRSLVIMLLGGPLGLIFGPALYIFFAAISLSQFKILYNFLARVVYQKHSNVVWETVQPALRQQMAFFESIFGQPATFTPSVTHVLLVAIMLVLIVNQRR